VQRLSELCRRSRVTVATDDADQARTLDVAAGASRSRIGVVIEVDIGIHRAGVDPGAPVTALAEQLVAMPNLDFRGVMGWEGHACPIPDPRAKEVAVAAATALLVASAEACRDRGIPVEVVSCGGTGTFPITARQPGVTELQAGGGVLSDVRYRDKYGVGLAQALTMMTTVLSRPKPSRIICDGGRKTMSDHPVVPLPQGLGLVKSVSLSAEHITVELVNPNERPLVGDTLEFVASYVDASVHLHDMIFAARRGIVEEIWPTRTDAGPLVRAEEAA
jgi:D-serine deaminase-like pyridoxal phosphate-dependent protein